MIAFSLQKTKTVYQKTLTYWIFMYNMIYNIYQLYTDRSRLYTYEWKINPNIGAYSTS